MEWIILILIALFAIVFYRLISFKNLYLQFTDGISIISDDKVIDCNDTLVELFKYKNKKEFLETHPLKLSPLFQPDGSFSFEKEHYMMEIVKKEGKCKLDWVFLTSKDEERWIEIDIFKIEKSIFFKNRYCMVWRDISKRIEAENKLKEFNENLESLIAKEIKKNQEQEHMLLVQSRLAQLGEMVSMIAHQWRQPLGAISSSIIDMQMKMVLEKDKDKILSFVKDELNDIESFTQSLTNTINDFRDFYRQDKVSKTVYINEPIEKAFSIIKNSLGVHDIQIEFDIKSNSKVEVFENELMQVFLNIFQNAKENFVYKEIQNPNIKVKAVDKDDFVVITICDNGGGIEEQILEKIFEPYFSTKSEINGTGLGLYMSLKIIVEHHKGKIKAYNTDDGICFLIKLKKGTING